MPRRPSGPLAGPPYLAACVSWLGLLVHNVADLPGRSAPGAIGVDVERQLGLAAIERTVRIDDSGRAWTMLATLWKNEPLSK